MVPSKARPSQPSSPRGGRHGARHWLEMNTITRSRRPLTPRVERPSTPIQPSTPPRMQPQPPPPPPIVNLPQVPPPATPPPDDIRSPPHHVTIPPLPPLEPPWGRPHISPPLNALTYASPLPPVLLDTLETIDDVRYLDLRPHVEINWRAVMPHLPVLLQMVPHPDDPWYHTMTWRPDQVQDEAVPNLCARLRLASAATLAHVLDYFQTYGLSMDSNLGSPRYYEEAVPAARNRGQQRERELALISQRRLREVSADEQARPQPIITRRRVRSSSTSTHSRRNRARPSRSSLPQPNDGSDMD